LGTALAVDERMDFKFPERRVPISVRIPESLRKHLDAVVKLWQLTASAEGHDPELIDLTYVVGQLLEDGVGNVWAKVGLAAGIPAEKTAQRPYPGMPVTDEEWSRLERALIKAAKEDQKSRK
jgi:hypothetical protein